MWERAWLQELTGTPSFLYIWAANIGNTAPAMERRKVFTAMALFDNGP